jgi:hypothetical protein
MKKKMIYSILLAVVMICMIFANNFTAYAAGEEEVGGVYAMSTGYVKRDSLTGIYSPVFDELKAYNTSGKKITCDVNSYAFNTSYSSKGDFGVELTSAPVIGKTYYSYIIINLPKQDYATIDEELIKITIEGYDIEYLDSVSISFSCESDCFDKILSSVTEITSGRATVEKLGEKFDFKE